MQHKMILFFIVLLCSHAAWAQMESVDLPPPQLKNKTTLIQALKERKSQRSFQEKELPLQILSDLLWAAFGVNRSAAGMRTAPSAHNAQEIDIYVAMSRGLYLYAPHEHKLQPVLDRDVRRHAGKQTITQTAPVDLIYVADLSKLREEQKIKDFYAAVDTGFISQNVYLYCAAEGLATVVLAWIEKEQLHDIMGLKSNQKIILTQPVGYPK